MWVSALTTGEPEQEVIGEKLAKQSGGSHADLIGLL